MAVIRLCAERYGKIPDINVVDGGKDLLGTDCQKLAASFHREFWIRPPHEGRFGSIIEAGNMALNKHLLDNIPGSTKIMKQVRKVTKSVNPENLPVVGIENLQFVLDKYMEILITEIHPALMMSPQSMMAQDLADFGERAHVQIPRGEELHLLTMPYVPGEKCKVQRGGAVKFNYTYYSNARLLNMVGKSVSVRLDPFDEAHVYAEIDGKPIECRSPYTEEYLRSRKYCRSLASAFLRAKKGCATKLRNKGIARRLQPFISGLHQIAKSPGKDAGAAPVAQTTSPVCETPSPSAAGAPSSASPVVAPLVENENNKTELEVIDI